MTVLRLDLSRPHHQILGSLAGRVMTLQDQFKILAAIVLTIAVFVMHVFIARQGATDHFGHHKPMFKNIALRAAHCVRRFVQSDVAVAINDAPASPRACSLCAEQSRVMTVDESLWPSEIRIELAARISRYRRFAAAPAPAYSSQKWLDIFRRFVTTSSSNPVLTGFRVVTSNETWQAVTMMAFARNFSPAPAFAYSTSNDFHSVILAQTRKRG